MTNKKPNHFDMESDRERIDRGLPPKYTTLADHGLAESDVPPEVAKPPKPSRQYQLSKHAHEAMTRVRETIAELRPLEKAPSASIAVEFLVWWFEETFKLDGKPVGADFRPKTNRGRPAGFYETREVAPSEIRKLAGVDPVTKKRKLY